MTDHDTIAPPPSLDDILSGGEDLIGRVDFGSRLVPEADGDEATDPAPRAPAPAKPAKAAKGAKAAKPAAERPSLQRVDVPEDEARSEEEATEPESFTEPELEPEPEPSADEAEQDWTDEAEQDRAEGVAPHRLQSLSAPAARPEHDVAFLGLSVEEVADAARTRMRVAEQAHLRHLEAIELEAARRLELLTAQAELDAELIRLHARREAHAIITAARTRTGTPGGSRPAERGLSEVGDAFSRFADSLESATVSAAASASEQRSRS